MRYIKLYDYSFNFNRKYIKQNSYYTIEYYSSDAHVLS